MFMARLPFGYSRLASRMAQTIGMAGVTFRGVDAPTILASAQSALRDESRGLLVLHWPDADRAGHASGWTSPAYRQAARRLDDTLGMLDALTGASADPDTLLIALADHGGGGRVARDHDSSHEHDRRIPLLLAGGRVRSGILDACSLLDVPATACWALGLPAPPSYGGRPLREAFGEPRRPSRLATGFPAPATLRIDAPDCEALCRT
jgi:arylsulfatase A-like enzyme